MSNEVQIELSGALGRITLNRPQAINALSLGMIKEITAALERWQDDPAVGAVLFTGNGEKGFCAGGDVRAARLAVIEGRPKDADAYFAAEYRMNGLIAGYPKPTVAMTHGVVMGGGIGIAGHCRFRFAVGDTRYAMPEGAIGFFADVGVNAILARAPFGRALLFLLSGATVGTADAIALGLADAAIPATARERVDAGIAAATRGENPDAGLARLVAAETVDPGPAEFAATADVAFPNLPETLAAFLDAAHHAPEVAAFADLLGRRSPTSLTAGFHAHLAARRLQHVPAVLEMDRRLAAFMVRQPDFAEGVRAVLVDKDHEPRWVPATPAGVDQTPILAEIAG